MLGKIKNNKTFDMIIEPGNSHRVPYIIYNKNCKITLLRVNYNIFCKYRTIQFSKNKFSYLVCNILIFCSIVK